MTAALGTVAGAAEARSGSPQADEDDSYGLSTELVTLGTRLTEDAEVIHGLVGQIIARQINGGRRGVAICGASQAVGVTFVATNLAVALAQAGVSTLLIDANLHNPGADRVIRPSRPPVGLCELLQSPEMDRAEGLHSNVLPNLSIIYAGGPAPDASELLGTHAFRQILEGCLRDFEFTVIDTPPANQSADARRISSVVGYSMIVARQGKSFVEDMATLSRELGEDGASLIGILLNGARKGIEAPVENSGGPGAN